MDLLALVFARPKEAVAAARAVLAGTPSPAEASVAHQVLGLYERDFGDLGAAVAHLRRAVRAGRRSGQDDRTADALGALGVALVHSGRTAAGLSTLSGAATLAKGRTAARIRFRLAAVLVVLGRHPEAAGELRRALPALRRAGDTVWVARALTLRGTIALGRGATDRADRDLGDAERLFATTEQEHDAAVAVHNRGLAALHAGDLPAALAYFDRAGRRYTTLGTPVTELVLDRCAALLAAGLAGDALSAADAELRRLDRHRGRATRRAELLLTAARAALAAGDPATARLRGTAAARLFTAQRRDWWSAHSRLLVLQCRLASGSLARLSGQAARIATRLDELGSDESTQAYLLAGRADLAAGRRAAAQSRLAVAARARRRGPALSRAGGWLAEALRAEAAGDTRRTLDACRRGLLVLQQHRLTLGATELRAQATAHGVQLLGTALRACLHDPDARRLLIWGDRWRATALAVPPVRPRGGPQDRSLRTGLARYRRITGELGRAPAGDATLRQRQAQAERDVRSVALRTGGGGAVPNRPLDVGALLDELGDGRLVALVPVGDDLQVLLCGGGRVRRLPAGGLSQAAAETEHARAALLRLAHRAAPRPQETLELLAETGRRLERLLFGEALARLDPGTRLTIVPPGRLHAVPWALLPALSGRVHEVAPSARAWLRARRLAPPPGGAVVLVRGPGLSADGDETPAVARLYERPVVLRDNAATAERVLSAIDGCALAHLSAHGTFRADSPLFSALRMVDGPLTAYDFERLRSAPYRLVLPSCDSARLAAAGTDELLGLAAALLPLGTAGIVGSVVPVDDPAMAAPMLALHRGLRSGLRLAEALRDVRAGGAADPAALAGIWSLVALGAA